ncbi:MAG: glycosyltransferase [Methylibium sp.]|nr:glycosyltransferase [Methylibium sp.]
MEPVPENPRGFEADAVNRSNIGVVVIGRNEGERLGRCLRSVQSGTAAVVYVDSGSSDDSAMLARAIGVEVLLLDMSRPFTAARARNTGLRRLHELQPDVQYVQFIDGDCELIGDWLATASRFLDEHYDVAVVCGRLRERFPQRSIYNLLCDMEWNRPAGEVRACGGIAMMRVEALAAVGGFREDLIAGEEPELCVRIRAGGARIWRLADEMAWHDAAMLHFGQWWRRATRAGYAYAEGSLLHGSSPERHYVPEARRALLWGAVLPLLIAVLSLHSPSWWVLLLLYPAQMLRLAWRDGIGQRERRWRAVFLVLSRFPEAQGMLRFWLNRWRRQRGALIEYK